MLSVLSVPVNRERGRAKVKRQVESKKSMEIISVVLLPTSPALSFFVFFSAVEAQASKVRMR